MFSVEAAIVAFLAVLPGATYVWCVERWVGRWGAGLTDRLLRFGGSSAVLHVALAPLTFRVIDGLRTRDVVTGSFPFEGWLLTLAYLAVPAVLGSIVGIGISRGWTIVRKFSALKPPTAWDQVFTRTRSGWVKLRLKSGGWIGGWFGELGDESSWVGGYPYQSDIYLVRSCPIDQVTGAFLTDDEGFPSELGSGILIRWDEVELLKFREVKT